MASVRKPPIQQAEKPAIQKPENFDLQKGLENVRRLVKKNEAWVREMAAK